MSLQHQIMQDTPSGYWPLDETSGTTAFDRSGNGRDGTYVNAPALNQDQFFRSPRFTAASSQRVEIPDQAAFDLIDTFTVSSWFRLATTGTIRALVSKGQDSFCMRHEVDGKIGFFKSQVGTPSRGSHNTMLSTEGWNHVAATKPPGTTTPDVLFNGVLSVQAGATGSFVANALKLAIGADIEVGGPTYVNHMDGWIAHVAFFPSVLSADRIKAHYEAGLRGGIMVG